MLVNSTITAKNMSEVYYTNIFHLYNLLKKIFLNYRPQFIAQYMRAFYKCLSIKIRLTTTYYSEGNGKVECKN